MPRVQAFRIPAILSRLKLEALFSALVQVYVQTPAAAQGL